MTFHLLATVMTLALMTGIAMAQTSSSDSTIPSIVAPPPGTLSTSRSQHVIDGNGTETTSDRTTYRNDAGVADDLHTTKTTHPAASTTTRSTSSSTTTR